MSFANPYPFDPSYGYSLTELLAVEPPPEPAGFAPFWRARYRYALSVEPGMRLQASASSLPGFCVQDLEYQSTDAFPIRGWLLTPLSGPPRLGLVLGHGYGGIEAPPRDLPRDDAAYLVPCFRGLSRSRRPPISADPNWHVLHDIHLRDRYILGGCVEDVWTGVSALLEIFPNLVGHIGYCGISFGGGIGAIALAWDERIGRGHLSVPSFGHQPLRLTLPTTGSGAAVQRFARTQGNVLATLAYYDAAVAARQILQPMHVAAARFDPAVAPPGQFAVYNAIPGTKSLYVLDAGHFEYPGRVRQDWELRSELRAFFAPL